MALILNIETATPLCSVALCRDGEIISLMETREEKAHASSLTVFIEKILKENNVRIADLDAVAAGKGPGSYTGLRIGISTAKGLCYGANIPLIAVSTLHIMFQYILLQNIQFSDAQAKYCPMIDARRMEVFTCILNARGEEIESVSARIIDSDTYKTSLEQNRMVFFGSGMEKCRDLLNHPNALFVPDISPHASALAKIAEKKFREREFENIAYFEPFYLKDFIATIPKKGLKV
jgi:tRNA threonylcarbamoyladenosine biosynthesis protein TsaB